MNDERAFEQLAAHAGPVDVDPGFEDRLYALLRREMRRPQRSARPALLLVAALLAILVISAAVAVGSGLVKLPWVVRVPPPSPSASAFASATPAPAATPALLRPLTTARSPYPPGEYWWDLADGIVWVHNPTGGTVGVEITISASEHEPGATAAVVAGHEGTYQRQGTRTEVWTADIEGTPITITVVADPVVTEAELAEAHAIVESIRTEPWASTIGFRILFTLPTGWDSA